MTHKELVVRAERWLATMGCPIRYAEFVSTGTSEIPDALGFKDGGKTSLLIECKSSRGDFLADAKKPHRQRGGMGRYRYFMCPPGLIKPGELPARWGLLYAKGNGVQIVAGKHPREYGGGTDWWHKADHAAELAVMYSALNRLRIDLGEAQFTRRLCLSYTERQEQPLRRIVLI